MYIQCFNKEAIFTCLVGLILMCSVPQCSFSSWYVRAITRKSTAERLLKSPVNFENSVTEKKDTLFLSHTHTHPNKFRPCLNTTILQGRGIGSLLWPLNHRNKILISLEVIIIIIAMFLICFSVMTHCDCKVILKN